MLKTGQNLSQKQSLQQKLSPQQIQFIKLLQLPTLGMEQRIKEEIEMNPVLEELDPEAREETLQENESDWELKDENEINDVDPVDKNEDIDWDSFLHNTEYDGNSYGTSGGDQEWRDLPNPYYESLYENLEKQVSLIDLDEKEILIADQILGSLDEDGYFRREIEAVIDNIAFNYSVLVEEKDVENVRKKIQNLEPVGIASKDLRDCLLSQLRKISEGSETKKHAIRIVEKEWSSFEKKHFEKLKSKLGIDDNQLKCAFELIKNMDPKPGAVANPNDDNQQYIEPDFEVFYEPSEKEDEDSDGEFVIRLNQRNVPPLRISPEYKQMWDQLKKKSGKDFARV